MARNKVLGAMVAAIGLLTVTGCGGGDNPCTGATKGCVQLKNTTPTEAVFVADGISTTVPAGTDAAPGIGWASVDPTVGAATRFAVSTGSLVKYTSCTVSAATWSNPNSPPAVTWVYTGHDFIGGIYYPTCSGW